MAQRQVTVGVAASLNVLLTLSATGLPATGLLAADLTCAYRKEGGSFVMKALAGQLTELGNGFYSIAFAGTELNTQGEFLFVVNGSTIAQFAGDAAVVSATQAATAASLLTCILTGYVFGMGGSPLSAATVSARVVGMPTMQGNIGVANATVSVDTDATGQFFLTLPRLALCDVTVSAVGYQARITVPNAPTGNLFTSA